MEALENGMLQIPARSLGFGRDPGSKSVTVEKGNVEYPEATAEIEHGVHQLETLLESTVDKAFDYFEIWTLRNVLTIPDNLAPWMRLGHYEVFDPLLHTSCAPGSTHVMIMVLMNPMIESAISNPPFRSDPRVHSPPPS